MIDVSHPNHLYCPMNEKTFQYEEENKALLKFYKSFENKKVYMNLFYHAAEGSIFFNKEYSTLAKKYAKVANYKEHETENIQTTFDGVIAKFIPNTYLIELLKIRAYPLSQFIDSTNDYFSTIIDNIKAIKIIIKDF